MARDDGATADDDGGVSADDAARTAERLAALERENAELRRLVATSTRPAVEPVRARRRPGRAAAAAVLLVVATLLAPAAAIAAWAERTLTDTERYVATVAPLARDPLVRQAVAGRITDEIMTRLDVAGIVDDAFGELQGALEDRGVAPRATAALSTLGAPLTNAVESFVRETADRLVTSPEFATLWTQANRTAHEQLVAVMRGSDGAVLQVGDDGQLTIQLSAVIDRLKERLAERGLDAVRSIPSIDASFTIAQSTQLVEVQNRYGQVVALGAWLPWVVLGLYAAGVLVAVRPLRALLGAGLALAGAMVMLGIALAVARGLYLDALTGRVLRLDAAEVVFDQLVSFLRGTPRTVGVLGLVVAGVAYLAGASASARALRRGVRTGVDRLRTRGDRHGVSTGAFGTWLGRHGRVVRVAVLAGAALVLLLADQPTPRLVVGTAIVAGVLVVLVELVARPARDADSVARDVGASDVGAGDSRAGDVGADEGAPGDGTTADAVRTT